MKKIVSLFVIVVVFFGCRQKGASGDPVEFTVKKESLDSTTIRTCRDADCSDIEVNYVRVKDSTDFGRMLNAGNAQQLINLINISSEVSPHSESVEEAVNDFVMDSQNGEDSTRGAYQAKIDQEVKSKNDNTVVLKTTFRISDKSAGNQLYEGIKFFNFDAHSGKYLSPKDLINDSEAFSGFVEKKLREKYEIPPQADINSQAQLFKNGKFELPENIAVTDKAVILLYNPYELADPEQGQIRFLFPKKTVEEYFNY